MTLSDAGSFASIIACGISAVGLWQAWPVLQRWRLERKAWKLYVNFRIEAEDRVSDFVKRFEPGTEGFELAELLVLQGRLFRNGFGDYQLTPVHDGDLV
jgi:hypothetical protein